MFGSKNPFVGTSKYFIRQFLATLASCLLSLSCGFTLAISAVLLPQLRNDQQFEYNEADYSWIASMSPLSMIIGSLSIGTILDACGRKKAHIIFGIPYIIGWLFIAFANSSTYILIGRFISGISAGAHRPLTLVYIGEISDPKYRVFSLFLPSLFSNIGVLICHIIGGYVYWRTAVLILAIPAVLGVIQFCYLKESPFWYVAKGRKEEAVTTFNWFRGIDDDSKKELATILEKQGDQTETSLRDALNIMFSRSFIKPFFVLLVLMFNVQFSGVNVFHFYSQDIYEETFGEKIDPFMLMLMTDFIRGIVGAVVCFAAKIMPKKKSYIGFNLGLIVSLISLIVYISLDISTNLWIAVLSLVLYISFSSTIVTVGWSFVPEIMPNKIRGIGSGLTSAMAFLFLFFLVKMSPGVVTWFGEAAMYGVFAISTGVTMLILSFMLPETNGKTLQSIEDSYNKSGSEPNKI